MAIRVRDGDMGRLSRDRYTGGCFPLHRPTTPESRAGAGASVVLDFAVLLSDDRRSDD